jgi:hypothetical protein
MPLSGLATWGALKFLVEPHMMTSTQPEPRPPDGATKQRKRIEDPFYPVTWKQAIQDYSDGILTPRGLIYCYFVTSLRPGTEKEIDVSELCSFLKIHEATYYRAIGALKAKGRLNIRRGKMTVGVPEIHTLQSFSLSCENDSHKCELTSQDCELNSHKCELTSQPCENGNEPKPSTDGVFRRNANVPNKQTDLKDLRNKTVPPNPPCFKGIDREGTGTSNTDPLTVDVEGLCRFLDNSGVRPNKTIQETIAVLILEAGSAVATRAVENAISALREQQQKGTVRNPGGFLNAALKRNYTANDAKREAREKRKERPPSLNEICVAIDQAIMRGDREFALDKLRQLWFEGWHDQVEELCILRKKDWGFSIIEEGVRDGKT